MRKIFTALVAAGSVAAATVPIAGTADAQSVGWGGSANWWVGGDYYLPSATYGYGAAPPYNAAPLYNAAPVYNAAPLYNYGSIPAYGTTAVVEPMQTVQTVERVRTVRPAARPIARREVVTRQTTISSFNTYSQPLYNYAGSVPVASPPVYDTAGDYDYGTNYAAPLYNTVAAPVTQTLAAPVITAPAYRYVYEWDRILVIDPSTNLAVQALPR
jgi:hypothetical protein